ncbi:hypothetical protein GQR58_015396 [Nymphon striatum]|nr:hypothetical protein GQR58_015396 [Nymphon striatum]
MTITIDIVQLVQVNEFQYLDQLITDDPNYLYQMSSIRETNVTFDPTLEATACSIINSNIKYNISILISFYPPPVSQFFHILYQINSFVIVVVVSYPFLQAFNYGMDSPVK